MILTSNASLANDRVTVIDGDTIKYGTTRIRLKEIDAPELGQECKNKTTGFTFDCGEKSKKTLLQLMQSRSIRCKYDARDDKYGRKLGTCFAGELNLNAAMISKGWAVTPDGYPSQYRLLEYGAKEAGRGIWETIFIHPREWRKFKK
ncbi:thermonuclease family protein [Roseibium sp.]|uniref:thermonuclease family protein n=1 Tax=Roseibium sp. TaxID=1936156 RepID=UPI0032982CED